jgi:ADP-dependent NAD(P)H-hydrate dehydratase
VPPADAPAVTPHLLRAWPLPQPDGDGGKHARGTVLVVGGAVSTPGAVLLAGLAALRVGAGKLKVATVGPTAVALAVALPEAMVTGLPPDDGGSLGTACVEEVCGLAERADAVLVGPGLLGREGTAELLQALLPGLPDVPVVLDAVALGALARVPEAAAGLRGRLVLTPNAGEAAELLDGDERKGLDAARAVAGRYGAAVAAHGGVADADGRAWRDESGGPGLGTSGSGDVLAGVVAGLLARGATPAQAAVHGQYLHSTAGDRLSARAAPLGFLARELLDELPGALATVGT